MKPESLCFVLAEQLSTCHQHQLHYTNTYCDQAIKLGISGARPPSNVKSYQKKMHGAGKKEDGQWYPRWTTLPEASKICQEFVKCGCKKRCSGRCKCKTAHLKCTQLCMCKGQWELMYKSMNTRNWWLMNEECTKNTHISQLCKNVFYQVMELWWLRE